MTDSSSFAVKLESFSLTLRSVNWRDISSVGGLMAHVLDLKSHLPERRRDQLEPLIRALVDELNELILGRHHDINLCLHRAGIFFEAASKEVYQLYY